MADSTSFVDFLIDAAPPWLKRRWGARYLTVIGLLYDAYREAAEAAVRARYVRYTPPDALPEAGTHYSIERLVGETDEGYRGRLRRAFPSHRQGGSATGLQARLHEAGYTTATVVEAHDWSVDDGGSWARYWVVVEQPHPFSVAELWSDPGTWGDGGVWLDLSPKEQADQIRRLTRKWGQGAHAQPVSLIVVLSGELWGSPSGGTWGDAGTWGGSAEYVSLS